MKLCVRLVICLCYTKIYRQQNIKKKTIFPVTNPWRLATLNDKKICMYNTHIRLQGIQFFFPRVDLLFCVRRKFFTVLLTV